MNERQDPGQPDERPASRSPKGVLFGLTAAFLTVLSGVVMVSVFAPSEPVPVVAITPSCGLTSTDALGPYYKPDSPERELTGSGQFVISGTVRSWPSCEVVAGAMVEFWQVGANGTYTDDQRATLYTGADGTYRYASDFPGTYEGRPVHIHVRVSGQPIVTLVTQLYPSSERARGEMSGNLVALAVGRTPPDGYRTDPPDQPVR